MTSLQSASSCNCISYAGTVKPLYSEQSRDPKKCSLCRGVHLRGVTYVHVPAIQYTHIKMVPSLLVRDSSGGRAIFRDSFYFFLDFMIFYTGTCISHRLIVYHSLSIHSPRLDVHTMTAICKLIGIFPISLKHCCHDWETNKTLSAWYSHGNLRSLATMDLDEAGVNISHHLPVSMQSLVELSC